jgi:hypothetical protein
VELIARKLGDEIGQKVFEQRKEDLEKLFEEKYQN